LATESSSLAVGRPCGMFTHPSFSTGISRGYPTTAMPTVGLIPLGSSPQRVRKCVRWCPTSPRDNGDGGNRGDSRYRLAHRCSPAHTHRCSSPADNSAGRRGAGADRNLPTGGPRQRPAAVYFDAHRAARNRDTSDRSDAIRPALRGPGCSHLLNASRVSRPQTRCSSRSATSPMPTPRRQTLRKLYAYQSPPSPTVAE
jgi:hypothetical protein